MIPEQEKITVCPVANGWLLSMYSWSEVDGIWKSGHQYVFQESDILFEVLKKHIMSTKSVDAVHYE